MAVMQEDHPKYEGVAVLLDDRPWNWQYDAHIRRKGAQHNLSSVVTVVHSILGLLGRVPLRTLPWLGTFSGRPNA